MTHENHACDCPVPCWPLHPRPVLPPAPCSAHTLRRPTGPLQEGTKSATVRTSITGPDRRPHDHYEGQGRPPGRPCRAPQGSAKKPEECNWALRKTDQKMLIELQRKHINKHVDSKLSGQTSLVLVTYWHETQQINLSPGELHGEQVR